MVASINILHKSHECSSYCGSGKSRREYFVKILMVALSELTTYRKLGSANTFTIITSIIVQSFAAVCVFCEPNKDPKTEYDEIYFHHIFADWSHFESHKVYRHRPRKILMYSKFKLPSFVSFFYVIFRADATSYLKLICFQWECTFNSALTCYIEVYAVCR